MSEEKQQEVLKFFSTVREEYENRIGFKMRTQSRLRVQVEARGAIINAIRPYGTLMNIAKVMDKKDHSTIVHSLKSHETHFAFSPNYRAKYKIALETVRDTAVANGVDPHFNQYTLDSMREEIQAIKRVLNMNIDLINKFYNKAEIQKAHWMKKLEDEILSLPSEVV